MWSYMTLYIPSLEQIHMSTRYIQVYIMYVCITSCKWSRQAGPPPSTAEDLAGQSAAVTDAD